MRAHARTLLIASLVAALATTAALAAERARRERTGHGKMLQQITQQIRAGRSVTKRVERDPRASAEVKQKAAQLDQLLDARERTLTKLDALYRAFLTQHKAELDELEDLHQRAIAIDQRLGDARDALVQANRPDIDDVKQGSQQARQLAEGLRSSYELDRRSRRQR